MGGAFPAIDMSLANDVNNIFYNCQSVTSYPTTLDFSGADNLSWIFGYNYAVTSIPNIGNTSLATNLYYAFYQCNALTCLGEVNSTAATDTTNMFTGCTVLTAPTSGEQTSIANTGAGGLNYVNGGSCP